MAYVDWINSMPFDVGNTCKASTLGKDSLTFHSLNSLGVYLVRHNTDENKEMRLVDLAVRMSVAGLFKPIPLFTF